MQLRKSDGWSSNDLQRIRRHKEGKKISESVVNVLFSAGLAPSNAIAVEGFSRSVPSFHKMDFLIEIPSSYARARMNTGFLFCVILVKRQIGNCSSPDVLKKDTKD